jgi:TRAP-type C4-dicarboxylate transport system permease small subunit
MRNFCDRIARPVDLATNALAIIGLAILMSFAALTLLDGLLRGLADAPIEAVRDLGGLTVAVSMACCIPLGLWKRHNITITFIDEIIPAWVARLLTAGAALVVLATMISMAYQLEIYSAKLHRASDTTVMLGVASSPFWFIVAAIFWCAAAVQLLVTIVEIARATGVKIEEPVADEPSVL